MISDYFYLVSFELNIKLNVDYVAYASKIPFVLNLVEFQHILL